MPNAKPDAKDGPTASGSRNADPYVPACALVLRGLGIGAADLNADQVTVSAPFLKRLISALAAGSRFDEHWYAERYPDVQGAFLAGDVASLHRHFLDSGYFEGRLPSEPSLDPEWYRAHHGDLASAFQPGDVDGLRDHFESFGYHEGRAGTPETLKQAEEWAAAAR